MKINSCVIFCLVICIGYSQNSYPSPFKGATTITITTNDSGKDLYKRFEKYLTLKGYRIKRSDHDSLHLFTEPRETTRYNYSYIINAAIDKSKVIITIDWRGDNGDPSEGDTTSFSVWNYQSGKKEPREVIYNNLMAHFTSFSKRSISYSR